MKIFKRAVSIFLALVLLFALAACGNDGSGAALSYPIEPQPECLDPQIAQGAEAKTVVLNCFEGLVRKDSEGKFSPAAAKSWSYDRASLTYTFKLREDARWVIMKKAYKSILGDDIDNTFDSRVTAADFVFALKRAVNPATGAPEAMSLGVIKNAKSIINGKLSPDKLGVSAVGDFGLRITLEHATDEAAFLDLLTKAVCMPCNETFFNATKGRYGLDYSTLMCNGPFYLSYWLHDSALTIKNNDDYTGPFPAKPASVSLVIDSDGNQKLKYLLDGTYCAAQLGTVAPDSSSLTVTKNYDTVWALCFNCSDAPKRKRTTPQPAAPRTLHGGGHFVSDSRQRGYAKDIFRHSALLLCGRGCGFKQRAREHTRPRHEQSRRILGERKEKYNGQNKPRDNLPAGARKRHAPHDPGLAENIRPERQFHRRRARLGGALLKSAGRRLSDSPRLHVVGHNRRRGLSLDAFLAGDEQYCPTQGLAV